MQFGKEVGAVRLENGGPCWLLKLRWMGNQRVQMKGVLTLLVRWACRAGKRDFYSASADLVGQVQSPYTISMPLSPSYSKLGRQSWWVVSLLVCVSGWETGNDQLYLCPKRKTNYVTWTIGALYSGLWKSSGQTDCFNLAVRLDSVESCINIGQQRSVSFRASCGLC